MPLATAQAFACELAFTLMSVVTLIRTERGYYAMPASEFDGDPDTVVHNYDPFEQ